MMIINKQNDFILKRDLKLEDIEINNIFSINES